MTKINVKYISKLANFTLTPEEEKKFDKQLSAVLDHIEELSTVNIENVEETSQVTGLTDVERNDEVTPSLSQEEALSNAKATHNGSFEVPVIIEEAIE